ncbi:MAG: choice-of-anchor tandem repeat GloVer-containing protein [Limisphaerales bacterium]
MKTNVKPCRFIIALLSMATCATAQTLTTVVGFDGANGASPQADLAASGSMVYGTTYSGGSSNAGTIFAVNAIGNSFSNLYNFTGGNDGRGPQAGVVVSGNMLYGTTELGGLWGDGTVFAVNTNGGGFTNVYTFIGGNDGADPEAGLVLRSNTLFGTAYFGGRFGEGSVFRVNTNGSAFTNLYSFSGGTNGANPEAGLVLSGNTLYGTTYGGGSGYGTVFKVNIDGSSFSNVYSFTGGSDGANPEADMVLAGNTLYGTASGGGGGANGTVFSVNTNGGNFHSAQFDYGNGANPQAGLLLLGNTIYGTAVNGGNSGWGVVFDVNTNLSSISALYSFTDELDGAGPEGGLVMEGTALYGTTQADNSAGASGTVFAFNVPGLLPTLSIALQGSNHVALTWNNGSFVLQSAPTLTGTYTNVPSASSPWTNAITGAQQFFRLILPGN